MKRKFEIKRTTRETDIILSVDVDGKGVFKGETGSGFFDHMLQTFSKHSGIDIRISCTGDCYVDHHHTVEDVGICLGKSIASALGSMKGLTRYGDALLPMDEALIQSAADISGRGGCYCKLDIPAAKVGDFDTELCEEFFNAFSRSGGITLHIRQLSGENSHHIIEGVFKSVARSLNRAVTIRTDHEDDVPSAKGVI